MQVCCPVCATDFPVEAGLTEGDGKRLAASLAGMDPALGRAVISYLRLFKPAKTALRMARAVTICSELQKLVDAGTVCRDERTGVRRPASPALWAGGIEQMLAQRDRLVLPLANHNYLREVVYGLADKADAVAEQAREQAARTGRTFGPSPAAKQEDQFESQAAFIRNLSLLGQITNEEAAARIAALRQEAKA